jgi:hypothetical protein
VWPTVQSQTNHSFSHFFWVFPLYLFIHLFIYLFGEGEAFCTSLVDVVGIQSNPKSFVPDRIPKQRSDNIPMEKAPEKKGTGQMAQWK